MRSIEPGLDPADGPDPSLFFRPLRDQAPSEGFWVGFWPSVRAGIREAEIRPAARLTRGRALLLGSSAGVMVSAAILAVAFLIVPALPPSAPVAPAAVTLSTGGAASAEEAGPPPVLEDIRSASARVYTFHVGSAADATDVILIVDEQIDI